MSYEPVSVLISTRDRPQLLRRAIKSIMVQDYPGNIEIVVIFDQSEPDYSLETTEGNRTVVVAPNTRNPGLAGGRNSGIDKSSYDWIAFCDDDDEWLPTKLTKQMDLLLLNPDSKMVVTSSLLARDDKEIDRPVDVSKVNYEGFLEDRIATVTPISFLFKKDMLDEIGMIDEQIPGGYGEDYDFLLRVSKFTDISVVPEPLVRIWWHSTSYYFERWKMIDDALEYILDKHSDIKKSNIGLSRIRAQQAIASGALKNRKRSLSLLKQAFKLNPKEKRLPIALLVNLGISPNRLLKIAQKFNKGF